MRDPHPAAELCAALGFLCAGGIAAIAIVAQLLQEIAPW
jgi:hypothetical protein